MPMLFVRCHECETEFPSGIAPTSGAPGGVLLVGVLARCPRCGNTSPYSTHEFYFAGPAPITPPPDGVSVPPANSVALQRSHEDHSATPSEDAPQGETPASIRARPGH